MRLVVSFSGVKGMRKAQSDIYHFFGKPFFTPTMLDQKAFERWREFLVKFKEKGYRSDYTSQPIKKFISEIIHDGDPPKQLSNRNVSILFIDCIQEINENGHEEERKVCTIFLLLFAPTWLSLKVDEVGRNSKASTNNYLFDLEFEWLDWDLNSTVDLVDKARLSNEMLGEMVQLTHVEMSTNLNEIASSDMFKGSVLRPLTLLLSEYADIGSYPQEAIPPTSSGNVKDGPKDLAGIAKPDEALTTKVPKSQGKNREEKVDGDSKGKKRKREEQEAEEDRKNRERDERDERAQKRQNARQNVERTEAANEEGKKEMDEIFFTVMEYKRYPLHKSLHDALQENKDPKEGMGVFQHKKSPFQQLAQQILSAKSFGGILTDSFHAFVTEINLKKLENGIKYKVENGIRIPKLPLVVKYVNLRSQYPSLPLSFASTNIDWNERTKNELPEDKSWRIDNFQKLLEKAHKAVKKKDDGRMKSEESFSSSQNTTQPSAAPYSELIGSQRDKERIDKRQEGHNPSSQAPSNRNELGANQSFESSNAPQSQISESQDKGTPNKRSEGNLKGDNYGFDNSITEDLINPYDISIDTSIASHEDRPDKIPKVFVYSKDVIEAYEYENCRLFKVKARALMEAIIPEDRVGLGDEDILAVKIVVLSEKDYAYSKEYKKYLETRKADKENAFIDQILPRISGFNNCYLRHRAVNIRIFGDGPYTAHFVLSRFIENKDVPLETIKDKVEEQKRILRSGSVVHEDLEPRNILYDGEKVYIIDFGLATHIEH